MEKKNPLELERKYVWDELDEAGRKELMAVGEKYKQFLSNGKTERLCAKEIIEIAEARGYKEITSYSSLKTGDKIYCTNRNKGVALAVIGERSLTEGMNVVGSHIDSPRLDIKQNPLYEDSGMTLLKTHYYGGIKKYQWVSLPLAIYGVVVKKDGETVKIAIGDEDDDPVFFITDLLPHLAKDQMEKTMATGIEGEALNVVIGGLPIDDKEDKARFKNSMLALLNDKYGITEADFTSAEIEVVPAGKARDEGFDRIFVSAYGQDDKVCAFASLDAQMEVETCGKTAVSIFVDKEEIGSYGNTGMQSEFFCDFVSELIARENKSSFSDIMLRRCLQHSSVLSADVCAGFDPTYASVYEPMNTAYMGKGGAVIKYTGSRGKAGSNDANAEMIGALRKLFEENHVVFQTSELGKVDAGGGGTIAYMMADLDMDVIDLGVPVLSMHAPFELTSKADMYMTKLAYAAFLKHFNFR